MERLSGVLKNHDWGSPTAIPEFLGVEPDGNPWAEVWFGAHPLGPSPVAADKDLAQLIEEDAQRTLGPSTLHSLGNELPYLVKLIAPAMSLSLQVHPNRVKAAGGFGWEESTGIPQDDRARSFPDATHKPEILYALTPVDALIGFSVRRQARRRLEGLDTTLSSRLHRRLMLAAGRGLRPVVSWILDPEDGPTPDEINQFAAACTKRLEEGGSPDPYIDETMGRLQQQFPGDPGIVIAFLMNHAHLQPGDAVFVPTGTIHAYQHGLGLEVMANSDNVVRAGLTSKHVDRDLFLDLALFDGLPATRIAPEHPVPGIDMFRSPVEDFELAIASPTGSPLPVPGTGPRILVGLGGTPTVETRQESIVLPQGHAVFVGDAEGQIVLHGDGRVAAITVP